MMVVRIGIGARAIASSVAASSAASTAGSTARAAFVYYEVIIAHLYDISVTPGSVALLPNREIHVEAPRLIGP
jgi:hypothetical protein